MKMVPVISYILMVLAIVFTYMGLRRGANKYLSLGAMWLDLLVIIVAGILVNRVL